MTPKMSIDEFIERLSKVKLPWFIRRGEIRTVINGEYTCPICAVDGVSGENTVESETRLGLAFSDGTKIITAADNDFKIDSLRGNLYHELRKRLIEATNPIRL